MQTEPLFTRWGGVRLIAADTDEAAARFLSELTHLQFAKREHLDRHAKRLL